MRDSIEAASWRSFCCIFSRRRLRSSTCFDGFVLATVVIVGTMAAGSTAAATVIGGTATIGAGAGRVVGVVRRVAATSFTAGRGAGSGAGAATSEASNWRASSVPAAAPASLPAVAGAVVLVGRVAAVPGC